MLPRRWGQISPRGREALRGGAQPPFVVSQMHRSVRRGRNLGRRQQRGIDAEACVSCGACTVVCPTEALVPVEPADVELASAAAEATRALGGNLSVFACARMAARREGDPDKYVSVPALRAWRKASFCSLPHTVWTMWCSSTERVRLASSAVRARASRRRLSRRTPCSRRRGRAFAFAAPRSFPPEGGRDDPGASRSPQRAAEFFSQAGGMAKRRREGRDGEGARRDARQAE